MEVKAVRRNKIVNKLIVGFIILIILCIYFSKTINNMLLPEVTIVRPAQESIGDSFETDGTIDYENTHKILKMPGWSIKEVDVKVNQSVKSGDVLAKVDNDAVTLKEREEEVAIMKLQDQLKALQNPSQSPSKDQNDSKPAEQTEGDKSELEYEIATENQKYKDIRKGLTADGSIVSDIAGKVIKINASQSVSEGDSSSDAPSGVLFEIVSDTPSYSVNWTAAENDAAKFSVGQSVDVFIESGTEGGDSKAVKASAEITEKNYDSEKAQYDFKAALKGNVSAKAGDKVTIDSGTQGKKYENVIPKSCLINENGNYYVYTASEHSGALSGDIKVKKVQVEVTASDDINCAIKSTDGSQVGQDSYGIVSNTSKPLDDNVEVKIANASSSR